VGAAPSGRDLVLAHLGGDRGAFDEIVRWYYPTLFGHARRLLRDERLAEDAVQEAFLRAYRALPAFAGEYQLGAWLHRIVANVCATDGARRSRDMDAEERWVSLATVESFGPEEHSEHVEARARVVSAINQLSPSYREALVLRDVMELEYSDVADRSGISEQNARARVSRARAALRRIVEPTAAFGALVARGFRRGTRWAPRVYSHVASSANAVSEAVNMPSRAGAITAVATTSVAAVAVAVPLFGGSFTPSAPPAPRTQQVVAGQPATPATTASASSKVWVATAALPTTSAAPSPSTTTSTSTTSSTTIAPVVAVVAPLVTTSTSTTAPLPQTLAVLDSSSVATDSGGGATEEPGILTIGGTNEAGRLTTQLSVPSTGADACSGSLDGRFIWGDSAANPNAHRVSITSGFASAEQVTGATVYHLAGFADVTGGVGDFDGYTAVSGTVTVPADGSDGRLDLTFTHADGPVSVPACAGSSPSTSTSTSTTVAGGSDQAGATATAIAP
jgi:RNA polymerase sigma-70 factor (ECF subfamily)